MKITVVTPTFNQAATIAETLESVRSQTLGARLQYLVVDGLSTDGTEQIVTRYAPIFAADGTEFLYIREKDAGQSDAVNKGWRRATGDILAYLNSDDLYEPEALSAVLYYFERHPEVKWAYGGWRLIAEDGSVHVTKEPGHFSRAMQLNHSLIGQPSVFFRRELLEEFGMLRPELHLAMDYDLWLRFGTRYPAGIIPGVLSRMRYSAGVKSATSVRAQLREILRLGAQYTHPLSWRRGMQYFYYLRGLAVVVLGVNVPRRVEMARKWRARGNPSAGGP
jgi:glycosyltransferase involved in cell wall biosynthesis